MSEQFVPLKNHPPATTFKKIAFSLRLMFDFQVNTVYSALRMLLPSFKGDVVDIGAGESPYKHLLTDKGVRYIGLDTHEAAKFGYGDQDVRYFDGKTMPFEDGSVDNLLCTEVLEHVEDPKAFADEMHRILKPGGSAVITVPWSARYHYIPFDYFRFTPAAIKSLFSSFSDISIEPRGTDIVVIISKIIVAYARLFFPKNKALLVITLPVAALFAPCICFCDLIGHLCLWLKLGSTDDPLGYTILVKK